MRLLRLRFTVGGILLAVAVIAANCALFRLLYRLLQQAYSGSRLDPLSIEYFAGLVPMLNVAVIGILLFAARSIRRGRGERQAPDPPVATAYGTFFTAHLLALGFLLAFYTPGAIERYLNLLVRLSDSSIVEWAWKTWNKIFDSYDGIQSKLIDASVILGILLSGPLLLFASIGRRLACSSATSLSNRRFAALAGLAWVGFAAVDLAVALTPQPFKAELDVALDFRVVDRSSKRPIDRAFIRTASAFANLNDEPAIQPATFTDRTGRACLTGRFHARGQRNAFQSFGSFSPWGQWLEIHAQGYATLRVPLPEAVAGQNDLQHRALQTIALVRGKSPDDPCSDIAGTYSTRSNGFGGDALEILADGRFAWNSSGCTFSHWEYGVVKCQGEEIQLISVPNPGAESDPVVSQPKRLIEWGQRMYFVDTDDYHLWRFCRDSLTWNPAVDPSRSYTGMLRESDRDKGPAGLPRLPLRIWLTFLREETSLKNDENALTRVVRLLIPWRVFQLNGVSWFWEGEAPSEPLKEEARQETSRPGSTQGDPVRGNK